MGKQLVWRCIQDNQWEGIYPGDKSLYCIHDQNKLSREANGQCWKPTIIGTHFKKLLIRISNISSYLGTNISSRLGSYAEIFVARNNRIMRYYCTFFLLSCHRST